MNKATDTVLWSVDKRVATLTWNRPDQLNALTPEMEEMWADRLDEASADPEIRAIVVTGAGRGFCAGADMSFMDDLSSGENPVDEQGRERTFVGARPHLAASVPKPVIAAINGPCAGLGLVHALFCDVRFAAQGAKITTAFARRGLIAEYGISWILPRVAGLSTALDLLMSGRVILAEEALELGLVDRVLPGERLLDEARDYARELAENSAPRLMAIMKQQIYGDIERGLDAAVEEATELMVASLGRPDFEEGVQSYLERRKPRFADLVAES